MRDLTQDCNCLCGIFVDEDGDLGVKEEAAFAVFFGDAGGGLGWGESLDGEIADEGEGDFAGVENADMLVELGLTEDVDAEEVAGPDEEAFRWRGGIRRWLGRGCGVRRGGGWL
jgi:hypothetical protein